MTKREYLRSLGFQVGERGRFTDPMKQALLEYKGTFDEPSSSATRVTKADTWMPHSPVPVREYYALLGWTKYNTPVQFTGCTRCAANMKYCICPDGIVAPSIVVRSDDPLVVCKPSPQYV